MAALLPQVVFTDEQALMGEKALYSSTSDEAISIPSGKDDQILESSQPESQVGGAFAQPLSQRCVQYTN